MEIMGHSPSSQHPVLIIGAGIAGLVLAQGLRLRSIPFRIFERHPRENSSQGHRFRLSKDGVAALESVLLPRSKNLLLRTAAEKAHVQPRYVDTQMFEFEKAVPVLNPESMPIDRSWIRMLLMLGIEDAIEYQKEFTSYQTDVDGVRIFFLDGSSTNGSILVGADGIRSKVRKQIQPERRLLDLERCIIWGRTPLTKDLCQALPEDALTWFMAIDKDANIQAVVEPMIWSKSVKHESEDDLPDFEDYLYYALSTPTLNELPQSAAARKEVMHEITKTWHPSLRLILTSALHEVSACAPILSSKPDIEISSSDLSSRIVLIGDASHPMSPMGGSGGDTAIRNAADLALSLGKYQSTETDLKMFRRSMGRRAKEKIEHSFRGGQKFWKGKEWFEYKETTT